MRAAWRSGAWLTRERLRTYPALVLATSCAALGWLWLGRTGLLDSFGRPLGTDFSQVWVAGRSVAAGQASAPFDPALHAAAQRAVFGPDAPFYSWSYPPPFLLVAAALAGLPYLVALLVWEGATLALCLAVVLAIAKRAWPDDRQPATGAVLLLALGCPAVFTTLTHGQNGFLSAALLGGGLLLGPRRPVAAGVLFGLMAYKPQFALALPVALLAGGGWRTIVAAAGTVLALAAASAALLGPDSWRAFAGSLGFARTVLLEEGGTGYDRMMSAFAAARLLGAGVPAAYALQGLVTAAALAGTALVWRGGADPRLKASVLVSATLLATPYAFDYDLALLLPGFAFAAAHGMARGFAPGEASLMALAWIVPAVAREAGAALHLPLGFLVVGALFALQLRRALRESVPGAVATPLPA